MPRPMVRKIQVDSAGFGMFKRNVDQTSQRLLRKGGRSVFAEIVKRETRVDTGELRGSFRVSNVYSTGYGWAIEIYSTAEHAILQNQVGFRGRRPLRFFQNGLRAGYRKMLADFRSTFR